MKISTTPTKHILIKAYTNSDWDTCNLALIYLTEDLKEVLSNIHTYLEELQQLPAFSSISFYAKYMDFFAIDEEQTDIMEHLTKEEFQYQFVTLTEEEIREWQVPESRLHLYQLHVCRGGTFYFSAVGKHTNEEFWTDELFINILSNKC